MISTYYILKSYADKHIRLNVRAGDDLIINLLY